MQRLNLGLIGAGIWGTNFIRIINQHKGCRLYGICDKNEKILEKNRSNDSSIHLITNDYRELLDNPEIEAVIVATPVVTHYEIVKYALDHGKHVLCEKPLTISSRESLELKEIAKKNQCILMTGHIFLYNEGIIYSKEKVESGFLGDILYIHFQRTGLGPIRQDVNVLYDLASHDISMVLYILGKAPLSVSAFGQSHIQNDKEDVAFVQLEFDNKIMVNIHVSWIDPNKERKMTIVGTKKMLIFNDVSIDEKVKIYDRGISYQTTSGDFGDFQLAIRDGKIVIPNIKYPEPLMQEFNTFVDSIHQNKNPLSGGQYSFEVIRILEAAQKSLAQDNQKIYMD